MVALGPRLRGDDAMEAMLRFKFIFVVLSFVVSAAHADPVKLRVGWSDVPSSITPILGETPQRLH